MAAVNKMRVPLITWSLSSFPLTSFPVPNLSVNAATRDTLFPIKFAFFLLRMRTYRNFRPFTRTADYPQRSIFIIRGKKVQQITRTGRLPAPQNKRKSCYCITGIRTHKLGAMNIPCCCLQSRRSIAFSAKNLLLITEPETLSLSIFGLSC